MDDMSNESQAIGLLQELGLKEYEARSFVALSRRDYGTAKEISESSQVPRTRVYDAVRVLESRGLVDVQHASPQRFRAVSVEEAVRILRSEYERRTESLHEALDGLEPIEEGASTEVTHEVWTLADHNGITARTTRLVKNADREVVLVVGRPDVLDGTLADELVAAQERGVNVIVGTNTEELVEAARELLPGAEVFLSGLDWLSHSALPDDDTAISRLLLVDRQAILVSTVKLADGSAGEERAVFGRGFDNGLVTIVRRLIATGLLTERDPGVGGGTDPASDGDGDGDPEAGNGDVDIPDSDGGKRTGDAED
jgi:sugar-specific transcriptional regulator TrmB